MRWIYFIFLAASPVMADTIVPAGIINSNTTWNLAGSPYIVQGTLNVYSNVNPILTIEAGVEVRFQPGSALEIAYLSSVLSSVHSSYRGGLDVQGTLADPVLFTADNGLSGGWQGIRFNDSSDYSGAASVLRKLSDALLPEIQTSPCFKMSP